MPRARLIKPTFFTNEHLADIPAHGRLLFVGLWTIADREGRLEDRPKRIKAELFPYENVAVEPLLKKLESSGFIVRYEAGGKSLIAIPSFNKHQTPHHREPSSLLPAPGEPRPGPGLSLIPAQAEPRIEPPPSPAVTGNQLPVTGNRYAVSVEPEAQASMVLPEQPPAPERDLAETVISKLPVNHRHDSAAIDECYQFARDFPGMFVETAKAIEAVRRERLAPFPSNLRPHMPGWIESKSNGNRNGKPAALGPGDETNEQLTARLEQRSLRRLGLFPVPDVLEQDAR